MAVVLPNASLRARVRTRPRARDNRGMPVTAPAEDLEVRGPYPGAVTDPDGSEGPDGGGWRLRVDPRCWPLTVGDVVDNVTTEQTFIVRDAHLVKLPGCSAVDFIRVLADLDPPVVP